MANNPALEPPPIDLLDRIILDMNRDMPLHAQLRRALRAIIDEQCVDGQKFFTEPQLIDRLKISQSTVRRALLDLTRDGFLRRRVAKGSFVLKQSRKKASLYTVNIILPEWNSEFLMAMLEALSGGCKQAGWNFRVHYAHQGDGAAEIYRAITGSPAEEGIILLSNEPRVTIDLDESFGERNYRVVNIDNFVPGCPGAFVGTGNEAVIRTGLDHLVSLGHRNITFLINEPEEHGNVIDRCRLFESEIEARGLNGSYVTHCGTKFFEDSFEAAYRKMPSIMTRRPSISAIFAMSDPGAWAALKWLAENKIRVPDDISVLGFSDDRPSRFTHPALTTLAHPVAEIARCALQILGGSGSQSAINLFAPTLVVRESTGPVARG